MLCENTSSILLSLLQPSKSLIANPHPIGLQSRSKTESLITKTSFRPFWKVSYLDNEEDRALLIAAVYLHDIGCVPSLKKTRFHPLDGVC